VPADVKRAVYARDGEQCAFVGPDGSRCPARGFLQRDHVQPFARGGSNEVSNIRTLCAAHNDYEAKRVFGEALIAARKVRPRKSVAVESDLTPEIREIFETARRALRGMGFRQDETSRTIDAMVREHAALPLPPLVDLIREALARLTEKSS